jgi:hypothetical protein
MTHHVPLLLTPENSASISLVIRDAGRDYVRTINQTYRRTGTLRESRYKSSLVDQTRYCLACYRYIERNPVRTGMVMQPEDYSWSSYTCNAPGANSSLIWPHEVCIRPLIPCLFASLFVAQNQGYRDRSTRLRQAASCDTLYAPTSIHKRGTGRC